MATVLVTGGTGEIARGVVAYLRPRFKLRLFAPDAAHEDLRFIRGDVLDRFSLLLAMTGADAVLHLAVASGHSGPYEEDTFNDLRYDVNVKGTQHVFECAVRSGIRRVVHVSSVMAVWGRRGEILIPGDAPPKPIGTYALTKALGEQIAGYFAERYHLEVPVLRISAPFDPIAVDLTSRRIRPQQIPFPDLAQAFERALTVPWSGCRVVTIVGWSARCPWDLEPARQLLDYRPTVNLDKLGVELAEPFDVPVV